MSTWYDAERASKLRKNAADKEDENLRKQFKHDWKIAVFSACAGAFLSKPLWYGLDQIIQIFLTLLPK